MKALKNKGFGLNILLLFLMLSLGSYQGIAQEQSIKDAKKQQKESQKREMESLIESKTFTFEARTAIANGGRTVDLIDNPNFIKFSPDMVNSEMPFFGQATGATFYGANDAGLYFKGEPEKYDLDKNKKNFRIRMEVKDTNDRYRINLSVGIDGNSTITITSNRKSVMTYYGRIFK
jgi:hypothetical protein